MRLSALLTPNFDETLSSWLFRCSLNRHIIKFTRLELAERPLHWWEGLEFRSADPDVDFFSASQRLGEGREDINPEWLSVYFGLRNGTAVEWSYRRFFCPDCLRNDVANGHLPIWRKSWCYSQSCICSMHKKELVALSDASRYSKAWDAFVQECNSVSRSNVAEDPWFSRFRSTTLMKIEHFLTGSRASRRYIVVDLFNKLFCIFLQAPFHGGRGGSARIHFQTERGMRFSDPTSFEQSIFKGASIADPPSRFGSMIFAASLLDIIPYSRFLMFIEACEDAKIGLLISRDLHRAAAFPYVDGAGYRALHRYLGGFPRKDFPLLDRHLQLQEVRYAREGVLGLHLFGTVLD